MKEIVEETIEEASSLLDQQTSSKNMKLQEIVLKYGISGTYMRDPLKIRGQSRVEHNNNKTKTGHSERLDNLDEGSTFSLLQGTSVDRLYQIISFINELPNLNGLWLVSFYKLVASEVASSLVYLNT